MIALALLLPFTSAAETLVVGLGDQDYPPFYFSETPQDGGPAVLRGISIDVCNALAETLGYELEYRRFPFVRLLHDLEEGSIDMACTLFNTHDRAPGALYVSIPHALEEIYMIRMAPEDVTVSSGAALEDILLGGVRGYYYGPQQLSGLTLYNDDSQLPLNLINHRVQAVLSNLPTFRYFARAEGISDEAWVADPMPWFSGPIYMAFSRNREDSHELAAEFTKALVEFRKTEAYQAISDRYDLHAPPF